MKAIETRYKGYRFRSRLEARWAVFFDALGIRWEYEPQGFELPSGERYLPDFFLPGFNGTSGLWAEVKPEEDSAQKARAFAEASRQQLLVLDGTPNLRTYRLYSTEQGELHEDDCAFLEKYLPGGINAREYRLFLGATDFNAKFCGRHVVAAVYAARSARFEFGESGAPA